MYLREKRQKKTKERENEIWWTIEAINLIKSSLINIWRDSLAVCIWRDYQYSQRYEKKFIDLNTFNSNTSHHWKGNEYLKFFRIGFTHTCTHTEGNTDTYTGRNSRSNSQMDYIFLERGEALFVKNIISINLCGHSKSFMLPPERAAKSEHF